MLGLVGRERRAPQGGRGHELLDRVLLPGPGGRGLGGRGNGGDEDEEGGEGRAGNAHFGGSPINPRC